MGGCPAGRDQGVAYSKLCGLSWGPVRAVSHSLQPRRAILATALLFLAVSCLPQAAAELTKETLQAFEAYVRATEARLDRGLTERGPFLCMNAERHPRRQAIERALRRGEAPIHRLNGNDAEVPGGYVHHWLAVMFVPRADLQLAGAVSMDYDGYQRFHRPYVLDSKLISAFTGPTSSTPNSSNVTDTGRDSSFGWNSGS